VTERSLSKLAQNPADVFLEFVHPELKWISVGLVLMSAGFSIASIFSLARAPQGPVACRLGAIVTWLLFAIALVRGGQGFWEVYQTAEMLLLPQRAGDQVASSYGSFLHATSSILESAGGLFILGVLVYIGTRAMLLFTGRRTTAAEA
jgi:hypothetical protein